MAHLQIFAVGDETVADLMVAISSVLFLFFSGGSKEVLWSNETGVCAREMKISSFSFYIHQTLRDL